MIGPTKLETNEKPRVGGRAWLCTVVGLFLLPFVYLASVALLLSAYVHGWGVPSREFLRVYATPSNIMTAAPAVGSVYSNYFQFWVSVTKADYESEQNKSAEQLRRSRSARSGQFLAQ